MEIGKNPELKYTHFSSSAADIDTDRKTNLEINSDGETESEIKSKTKTEG